MQQPTQTQDDPHADSGLLRDSGCARLIRFLRADAPAAHMHEFCLGDHSVWMVGRIDSPYAANVSPDSALIYSRDDALMSAKHALLRRSTDCWEIEDTHSKNGTFVNGRRLVAPCVLQDGDIVECGSSFFIFRGPEARGGGLGVNVPASRDAVLAVPPLHYQIASVLPFAVSDLAIHLHGETGVGKDVVARAVHDLSGRPGAFVARNCAAIPDALFESELFGHARGAFSGATANKRGQMLEAHQGTLFLDEIGELSLAVQAKLLRALELKEVFPIGATHPVGVDFRLISATLCDLREMVAGGRFRMDLYARLGQTFVIPPLREHKEYIGVLLPALLAETGLAGVQGIADVRFTMAAARAIVRYSWPLNVRELKQCVQSALTAAWSARGSDRRLCIDTDDLPAPLISACEPTARSNSLRDTRPLRAQAIRRAKSSLSDAEILAALQDAGGNRAEAARALGISERTVFRRIRKLRPGEADRPVES